MPCGAAGWVKPLLRCLWCVRNVLQVDPSLDLHPCSSWFFIWMLQDQALPIRKWMKSLIRALNGILETFVCTWGSMYAEIKQQPLLACFLCSYNLSSRLCFSYCKSLSYIYVFIYLYSETSRACAVLGSNHGHVQPVKPHQGMEGLDLAACPASAQFGLLLLWLGHFWQLTDLLVSSVAHSGCYPWPWEVLVRSSLTFSWCAAPVLLRAHLHCLVAQLLPWAMLLLSSQTGPPQILKGHLLNITGDLQSFKQPFL